MLHNILTLEIKVMLITKASVVEWLALEAVEMLLRKNHKIKGREFDDSE